MKNAQFYAAVAVISAFPGLVFAGWSGYADGTSSRTMTPGNSWVKPANKPSVSISTAWPTEKKEKSPVLAGVISGLKADVVSPAVGGKNYNLKANSDWSGSAVKALQDFGAAAESFLRSAAKTAVKAFQDAFHFVFKPIEDMGKGTMSGIGNITTGGK